MVKQDDGFFLLEVLFEKLVFFKTTRFSGKDFRTCVDIECPAVIPLEICDDDSGTSTAISGGPFVKIFNNRFSCLFSLKEEDIGKAMNKFPIKVSVYKSLPCGCLPTKIVMGDTTIDMTNEFTQARKKFIEDPKSVSSEALKDSFRIVGEDGVETGEIVMFLRLSCFGKLIITRFQDAGPPLNVGAGGGTSAVIDRSCNPRSELQTTDDPCFCGAARGAGGSRGPPGGGGGSSHTARAPYNSMPCPDDPCFCASPKPAGKQQIECRNTNQYCPHFAKGTLLSLLFCQLQTEEQKEDIAATCNEVDSCNEKLIENVKLPVRCPRMDSVSTDYISSRSSYTLSSKESSFSFAYCMEESLNTGLFGKQETTVLMTLVDDFSQRRTSSTQATASINKCLQVVCGCKNEHTSNAILELKSNYSSTVPIRSIREGVDGKINHSTDFFEKNKEEPKPGMGSSGFNAKLQRSGIIIAAPVETKQYTASPFASQTTKTHGCSSGTSPCKGVCLLAKSDKPCPTASGVTKGDMVAKVSNIMIGPGEPCPVHGLVTCEVAHRRMEGEMQAPVKVSTVSNPRRGVFELVIRRITGAPLAKNELILEWTPPLSRAPCGRPGPMPCSPPGHSRRRKCKITVCRPSPCKPKYWAKGCKKPCGPMPCRSVPCKKCYNSSCCSKPCPSCKPCPPPPKSRPCPPLPCQRPCAPPCCSITCSSPCKSSPCLRPCPVGRRKPRKVRSQPRIQPRRKSPCWNRSKNCPVVRCLSVPGPCFGCCAKPPRKCCSVASCKPPKCCKSICSTSCE